MKTTLLLLIAVFCSAIIYGQYKVRFEVRSPEKIHLLDTIFIAGNFNNWNSSSKENSFSINDNGIGMFEIQLPAGSYEYKFTRGGWNRVEVTSVGRDIGNRDLVLQNDTTIYISIGEWKDDFPSEELPRRHTASSQVHIVDSAFNIPQLTRKRRIWIYLPKHYYQSSKRYPVIYMHDGQNVFDEAVSGFGEWGVDEYLDSISAAGKNESIVVAIDNGLDKRMNEYNPYYFERFGKGEGSQYVEFIVKNLKPYIDKHFHTSASKQNTFIAGSSMGGLISFYAVLKYPSVFGGAGIFSPAFWTANGIDEDVKKLSPKMKSKLFFYAGGKEGDKMIPDMKKIEAKVKQLSNSSLLEIIDPAAKHNETAWKLHFPEFYQWIFSK